MNPIPKRATAPTEYVSERRRDDNQAYGVTKLERSQSVWRLDEVQPENPIHQPLGQSGCNKDGPNQMPHPKQRAENNS